MKYNILEKKILNGLLVIMVLTFGLMAMGCQTADQDPVLRETMRQAQGLKDEAWAAFWKNDFAAADAGFQKVSEILSADSEAKRGRGLSLFALGDVFTAAELFLDSIEDDPGNPISVVVHNFVDQYIPYNQDLVRREVRLDHKLVSRGTDTAIGRLAGFNLLSYYRNTNANLGATESLAKKLGILSGWSILGPFPNGSGQGFHQSYINEESDSILQAVPESISHQWLPLQDDDPLGVVTVGNRLYSPEASVFYASATFSANQSADYRLTLDVNTAVKVWIDGDLVYNDSDYAGGNGKAWSAINLEKGDHQVLIKLAERDQSAWFRVSLFKSTEKAEQYFTQLSPPRGGNRTEFLLGPESMECNPTLAGLIMQAEYQDSAETAFWLGMGLLDSGHLSPLEKELYGINTLHSNIAILGSIPEGSSYRDWLESFIHSKRRRYDEARNIFVRSVDSGALFTPAFDFLLGEARNDQRLNEVERLLERVEATTGKGYTTRLAEYELALMQKEQGRAEALRNDIAETWPGAMDVLLIDMDYKNGAAELKNISNALSDLDLLGASKKILLRIARNSGDSETILKLSSELNKLYPNETRYIEDHLSSSWSLGKLELEEYISELRKYGSQFPNDRSTVQWVWSRAAGMWEGLNSFLIENKDVKNPADLRSNLSSLNELRITFGEKALELDPADFSLRNRIQEWKNEPEWHELVEVADPLSVVDRLRMDPPEAENDVQILNEEINIFQFVDGGYREVHSLVLRVNTAAGVRAESTQYIQNLGAANSYNIIMAYSLTPEGSRTRANEGAWRVNFPSLGPGDYIVLLYTIDGARTGTLSQHFWTSFVLDDRYPVIRRSYQLIYPNSVTLNIAKHRVSDLTITEKDEILESDSAYRHYSIEVKALPATPWNPGLPDSRDVMSWIDISSIEDWSTIAEWYRDIEYGRAVPTPAIQKIAAQLTAGAGTEDEIIRRLFTYAASEVAYEDLNFQYSAFVPQWAESVASDGFGDCKDKSTLLISLLSAAGIDSEIALSEPYYFGKEYFLPSPRFSHTIVVVTTTNGQILLDPTSNLLTYPTFPSVLSGTTYLVIPRETDEAASLDRIPLSEPLKSGIVVTLAPQDQVWIVTATLNLKGSHAPYLRTITQSSDPFTQKRNVFAIGDALVPGIRIEEYSITGTDNLDGEPSLHFVGELDRGPTGNEKRFSFNPNWFLGLPGEMSTRLALMEADDSFEFRYPHFSTMLKETWMITIPEGYRLVQTVNGTEQLGAAFITYSGFLEGRVAIQQREIYFPPMLVPASQITDLQVLYQNTIRYDKQALIFEK